MATLMEFAAMQLERDGYSSRADIIGPEDSTPHRPPFLHFGSAVKEEVPIRTPLLIIGIDGFGTSVLQNVVKVDEWEEIGILMLPEQSLRGTNLEKGMRKGICSIWRSAAKSMPAQASEQRIILVHASLKVPYHRANAWASVLLNRISAERVLILDGINALDIGGRCLDGEGGPLRALVTDGSQLVLPPSAGGGAVPPLETGAVVPGATAALLTRRLLRGAAATAVLAVLPDDGGGAIAASHAVIAEAVRVSAGDAAAAALLVEGGRRLRVAGGDGGNPLYL